MNIELEVAGVQMNVERIATSLEQIATHLTPPEPTPAQVVVEDRLVRAVRASIDRSMRTGSSVYGDQQLQHEIEGVVQHLNPHEARVLAEMVTRACQA